MKLKAELAKFGWKQLLKVAITLSVGVGLKWSCDEIEQHYYPKEIVVGEILVFTDTLWRAEVDTVIVVKKTVPDWVLEDYGRMLEEWIRATSAAPGTVFVVPFVDTVRVFDHVTTLDTVPWFEPEAVNQNGWRVRDNRP